MIARDNDLDLVEVAPNAVPPVCRIMDYGKWKFDAAQKAKESRRKTTQVTLKEMKYRVKIGQGDFDTKTRKVLTFLGEGHKVKITIMFRGRETAHPHLGKKILDEIAERAINMAKVEAAPKLDGRNMIMVLAPDKRAQAAAKSPRADGAEHDDTPSTNGAATVSAAGAPAAPLASTDHETPPPVDPQPAEQETVDAQDENAPGRSQALQADRLRQAHAPARQPPTHPRKEVERPDAAAVERRRDDRR